MNIERACTLSEITAAAIRIADGWAAKPGEPQETWFRGHCRGTYQLLPSLYRPENEGYAQMESSMMGRFESLATPIVQREYEPWEWYFLARHHHVPTRLLDWTESLVVAVRFALSEYCDRLGDRLALEAERRKVPGDPIFDEDSPCIWMLEAGGLNRFSIGEDVTLIPGGDRTRAYLPEESDDDADWQYPIAILPRRSNPRLAAQRGMFTVHGVDRRPLEVLSSRASAARNAGRESAFPLAKIELDRARLAHLLYELEMAGIERFGLFPDLDRVGEQVCWEYKQIPAKPRAS